MPLPPSPAVTMTVSVKSASIHAIVVTCTVADLDLHSLRLLDQDPAPKCNPDLDSAAYKIFHVEIY